MRNLSLAYIAGFVDGEGCISLGSRNKNNSTRVTIEIAQNKREVLDWIVSELGFGRVYTKKYKHGNTYCLSIFAKEGRIFIPLIFPYLIVKSKQAALLLKFYSIIDNKTYKSKEREILINSCIKNFRELNKRKGGTCGV